MTKLSTLLDEIDSGIVLLPEFQRGYVWNRDQVRGLMRSLYRGYPVGSLLMWETAPDSVSVRGDIAGAGVRHLLLDGQQRVTSLYGVLRGAAPPFFEGNAAAFTGLHFNVATEDFAFYQPTRMKGDPRWVDVHKLFKGGGIGPFISLFQQDPDNAQAYLERLNRLHQVRDRDFNIEKITGLDLTVDEVVDIFNKVNSGGTKLSKGDLALASICASWPEARQTMRDDLAVWDKAGYQFNLDWLLRNITAVAVQRSEFSSLEKVDAGQFRSSLERTVDHVGTFLDAAAGRLGLDHDRVLMGRYAIPVISLLLDEAGGHFADGAHRDKVLYWYVNSALRGRFSGSTETILNQDYETLRQGGIDLLINRLRRWRGGSLAITAEDFDGSTQGSRFYPLLYLLTRTSGARDFGSGLELKAELLGKLASLQIHHIFPKGHLRGRYDRSEVNAIANFCFLTQATNIQIGKRAPEDYLAEVAAKHPGALESQWIPTDPRLWTLDRYPDFLAARRELLGTAAENFMSGLLHGDLADHPVHDYDRRAVAIVEPDDSDDPRVAQVIALIDELTEHGATQPRVDTEISDPDTGVPLAVAEAFWPDGLQPGMGEPIVLELDPEEADLPRLEALGYKVFTSIDALQAFGAKSLSEAPDDDDGVGSRNEGKHRAPTPPTDEALTLEFHNAMVDICERSKREARYNPTQFRAMVAELGGLEAARILLAKPTVSDGFSILWEKGRLDLTIEEVVRKKQFAQLFSQEELDVAQLRLAQFGG
ncbi:GmrSD restriction endonuclease domain-containing protein [Gordonia sp. DT218]|uniref:GmrSD restriction endonuclease domain-containing protein n=1 Tax=Gordonia sp. DT218 TaxID=3416659 RepID=UPI003CF0091D